MIYSRKQVMNSDREELMSMVLVLQEKLKKRGEQLYKSRRQLTMAKNRITKMKSALEFQRKRIVELHP